MGKLDSIGLIKRDRFNRFWANCSGVKRKNKHCPYLLTSI